MEKRGGVICIELIYLQAPKAGRSDSSPKGAVARQYGVFREQNGITERALFFIDRDGVIRQTWCGEHPGIEPPFSIVLDALNDLRQGQN